MIYRWFVDEFEAWLRLASLVDLDVQEEADAVKAKVDVRCREHPEWPKAQAIDSIANDIEYGGNSLSTFAEEWDTLQRVGSVSWTGWCEECDNQIEPMTPVEEWSGPAPFPTGNDNEGMWTRYRSQCGHYLFARGDFGEIDLGVIRESVLNEPANKLTIFRNDDE